MKKSKDVKAVDLGRAETEKYQPNKEIKEEFEESAKKGSGSNELIEKLEKYNSKSPVLSGGDIDAAWEDSDVGEESVGGGNPTPDQDVVEELGEAMGLTYEDNEPLGGERKLDKRDKMRWELNRVSEKTN